MTLIFSIVSTIIFLWLTFYWSAQGALNCFIKALFTALTIFGAVVVLTNCGLVLAEGVKLT